MKIEVKQHHIDAGVKKNACPVALAINEKLEMQPGSVFVHPNIVSIGEGIHLWVVGLPLSVNTFIRQFDSGDKVEPFSFELQNDFDSKDNV